MQQFSLFQEVTRVEVVASGNASSDHCIQPAVTQFPSPILHKEQRKQGGVILHIVVAFYMFIGKKYFYSRPTLSLYYLFQEIRLF